MKKIVVLITLLTVGFFAFRIPKIQASGGFNYVGKVGPEVHGFRLVDYDSGYGLITDLRDYIDTVGLLKTFYAFQTQVGVAYTFIIDPFSPNQISFLSNSISKIELGKMNNDYYIRIYDLEGQIFNPTGVYNFTYYFQDEVSYIIAGDIKDDLIGWNLGYQTGLESGYDLGYDKGYDVAKDDYYDSRFEAGRLKGLAEGKNDLKSILAFVPGVLGAIFMFFFQVASVEVLGISLLSILTLIFTVGMLIFIIRIFFK